MKKISSFVVAISLSVVGMAQDNGMGNHNGNSSGNSSFSGTQMLLGGILIVLIFGGLVWFLNNYKKQNNAGRNINYWTKIICLQVT